MQAWEVGQGKMGAEQSLCQPRWHQPRKKRQSRDVVAASGPPCCFLRAFGSKNGGPEATATVSRQSLLKFPIQISTFEEIHRPVD